MGIRKKMQSLKSETDSLMATIAKFESATKESNAEIDKHECDIRDLGKKTQGYEVEFDETNDKLTKALAALEENKKADTNLAETVTKLAMASKEADGILKKVKYFENKTMRNEVEIEEADKNLRETTKMASDNEQKLDELTRKLGVQEDELKRANDRAELAEGKLKDKIHQLMDRLKHAEARYEYGEMNITKLNHRIDDIEDEIYREKLKIKKVSDELNDTFDDMLNNY